MEDSKYIYCTNCLELNDINSNFCQSCGAPLGIENKTWQTTESDKEEQNYQSTYSERKQEYVGKILKCPSCGAQLPSLTAICPDCGHEINAQKVSASLKEFIDSINECDEAIANDPEPPITGWTSWNQTERCLWIILNIITCFIPLIIYLTFPLIKPFLMPKSIPKLSVGEKRKTSLIENYVFPNERESTIEAMMFIKSKMAFLTSEKYNQKTLYWSNLWSTKAEELNQWANIILNDDKLVNSAFTQITANKNNINKIVKVRAIIGLVVIVIFLTLGLIVKVSLSGNFLGSSTHNTSSQIVDDNDFEWQETSLSTKIPKIDAKKGKYERNSDTVLQIYVNGISHNEFKSYVTSCKEMGYTVEPVSNTDEYTAYNNEGYYLAVYYYYGDYFRVALSAPQTGIADYKWPKNKLAQRIPSIKANSGATNIDEKEKCEIFLYDISDKEFNSYVNLCEKAGYVVKSEKSEQTYHGFDNKGYEISVSLNKTKRMSITLEAPMKMTEIYWPTYGVAKTLPKPKSKVGNITSNESSDFEVYVGDTTIKEYNNYVNKCIKKGFNQDVSRTDTEFSAENKKEDELEIEYTGFNTMKISIYN